MSKKNLKILRLYILELKLCLKVTKGCFKVAVASSERLVSDVLSQYAYNKEKRSIHCTLADLHLYKIH